jgi:hypothetical protein
MARIGWRLIAGLLALVATVSLTLPGVASRADLRAAVRWLWPTTTTVVVEIWPNGPASDGIDGYSVADLLGQS